MKIRSKKLNKQSCDDSASSSSGGAAADHGYGASCSNNGDDGLVCAVGASSCRRKRGRCSDNSSQITEEEIERRWFDTGRGKSSPVSSEVENLDTGKNRSSTLRRTEGKGCSTSHYHNQRQVRMTNFLRRRRRCRRTKSDDDDDDEEEEEDQRKARSATIYSWLMDSGVVAEDTEVYCVVENRRQSKFKGKLKREGVLCDCCSRVFTAEAFCKHSGGRFYQPYAKIFIARRRESLISCMIRAWNRPEESRRHEYNMIKPRGNVTDIYDDACMICADGGNLMCCETCNSTYHHDTCLRMEKVPEDSWYCAYCVCKFCGGPAHQNDACPQCAKKYHWDCHLQREPGIDLNSITCAPYCGPSCKEIHESLEKKLVGVEKRFDGGCSWTLLHRMDDGDSGVFLEDEYRRILCHAKLAVAHRLMEDCFESIRDRHTRIDVIQSVVYNCGANFTRINFRGFYTAILEKDDEIITAACLRIHGKNLAEMPFIGTSEKCRGQGMCRRLLTAIETFLGGLNVETLVIPSIRDKVDTWINKFGFHPLEASLVKEINCWNTLMFHDSDRLQKSLLQPCNLKTVPRDDDNAQDEGDVGIQQPSMMLELKRWI